jgi:hypothetical protein
MYSKLLTCLTIVFVVLALLPWFYGDTAHAVPQYGRDFATQYPSSPLSSLPNVSGQPGNRCSICHGVSGPPLNPYGSAFLGAGLNFVGIQGVDSDGDGATNIVEINAGTFPGDINSTPPASPTIGASPTSFTFTATVGGANPATQNLTISNTGGGTLNWAVTDDAPWLSLSPASGTDTGTVTLSVDITGLGAGTLNGTITVTDAAASNNPVTVPVALTLSATPPATMPVPSGGLQVFDYLAVVDPVADVDPAKAKPVGIGTYATGGSAFTVSLNLPQFSGPVDIYGAALSSVDQYIVSLVDPSLAAFQNLVPPLTVLEVDQAFATGIVPPGVVPTIANVAGPENRPNIISQAVSIPPFNEGLYTIYVVVTPHGDLTNAYLWRTNFNVAPVPVDFTTMTVATPLSGAEMVPPVTTTATGSATLSVDLLTGAITSSTISFTGLTANATAAHIHVGSAGTPLGPVIVPFTCPSATTGTCTPTSASPSLTPAQIVALMNDNLYFVVHSSAFPGGEIRGQVVYPIFRISAELSGGQEVPSNGTPGSGLAEFTVDTFTREIKGTVTFSGLTGGAVGAHIHKGFSGQNGPIQIPLEGGDGLTSGVYQVPAGTIMTAEQLNDLRGNGLYVNIHTPANPGGEIRGQIINVSGL